jgi:hypothetical protein
VPSRYPSGAGAGHVQSLIFTAILIGIGVQISIMAFVGDLMAVNRQLLEEIQYKMRIQASNSNLREEIDSHE